MTNTQIPAGAVLQAFPVRDYGHVRGELLAQREIALLDVREEDTHAQAHPLFAANLPASRIELDAYTKLPRRDVPVVVLDDAGNADGPAQSAAARLRKLGYTDVAVLAGGVQGWRDAGGELFRDVNVPSKAFGELVEAERHTPSVTAQELQARLDAGNKPVVLDARRFEEYRIMSIPGSISVPGAELVLRARELAPDPATPIVVNCAGRTRSIIGAQSLINAGIPNPVAALRNGTIGWTLAGQQLEHGQSRTYPAPAPPAYLPQAAREARALADRAGVQRANPATLAALRADAQRTTYFFDVRSPEEYAQGRLPGFRSAPGGQLVQETEQFGPVRGARFVLADLGGETGDGDARANMTASWLRQMNHEVYVADGVRAEYLTERGDWKAPLPPLPATEQVDAATLAAWLAADPLATVVLDLTTSANYARSHVAGAWFALRSDLKNAIASLPPEVQAGAQRFVLTCGSSLLALFAAEDLKALTDLPILVLAGGNAAWSAAGYATESGLDRLLSPAIDRYRRPYEGTDNPVEAMQAYLDWEYGLVAQLGRDGTHGFRVL